MIGHRIPTIYHRHVEVLMNGGETMRQACQKIGISLSAHKNWRRQHSAKRLSRGRPRISEDVFRRIQSRIDGGSTIVDACKAEGVSYGAFYLHRRQT